MRAPDACIVGAGIVGAACARVLAKEGLRVVVVDEAAVASGATAAGMGHLLVMDGSDAELALTRWSRELWCELAEELPPAAQWDPCGTLWLAQTETELRGAASRVVRLRREGCKVDVLDATALAEAEPGVAPALAGALYVPDDVVIYPPLAASWLARDAERSGATFQLGTRVARIQGRTVTLGDGTTIDAGTIVSAAGLRAVELLHDPPPGLQIQPKKGHLLITARYPRQMCRHQLVELGYADSTQSAADASVAFNLQPRLTGQLLLGSSRQPGDQSRDLDIDIVERMTRRALRFFPALADLQVVRAWTGLRPATADHLPLIGALPSEPNVVLAAGHEGLGITTCTATAQIVGDIVLGRESAIDRSPFAPGRVMEARACA